LPFMLCWANENWTRRWDGKDQEVLMEQNYSDQDDIDHMVHLIPFFKDKRYIKVNGKPMFVVYKPFLFPNATETAKRWREVAAEHGLELYLCHTVFSYTKDWNKLIDGFDAVIDFEPFGIRRESVFKEILKTKPNTTSFSYKLTNKIKRTLGIKEKNLSSSLNKLDYKIMSEKLELLSKFNFKMFPSIVPGWDNTSRRKNNPTLILDNSTPELFEKWLKFVVDDFEAYSEDENFIFINAWNEWAEGNHLEPCQKWGKAYLEKIKHVINNNN
jgi:hypothetical protein